MMDVWIQCAPGFQSKDSVSRTQDPSRMGLLPNVCPWGMIIKAQCAGIAVLTCTVLIHTLVHYIKLF